MNTGGVSAKALKYWEARQTAVSNNLANATTSGFKAERVFARLLDEVTLEARSATDFTAGSLNPTARPLDVALVGDGFLVVEGEAGAPRWLRGGSLSLSPDGKLVDGAGRAVLGEGGHIVLPPGHVTIDEAGEIRVDDAVVGRLKIERSSGEAAVEREGVNLWLPTDQKMDVPESEIRVRQGHLEDSNVDTVSALVEMIEIQRAYAAIQRSMQTETAVMETVTTEIGRVG